MNKHLIDGTLYVPRTLRKSDPNYYALSGTKPPSEPTAKELAIRAGLVKEPNRRSSIEELEAWFRDSTRPLLEKMFSPSGDDLIEREELIEAEYSARRSQRYRDAMQVAYASQQTGISRKRDSEGRVVRVAARIQAEIPGFYEWKFGGKHFRSWMGLRDLAIKPPKAIGGYLSAKYPGYDVTIVQDGVIESKAFIDERFCPAMILPKYSVTISKKLPGWYLTAERLLLEGRLLDRDAAKELWDNFQNERMSQQEYAERIATLCRQADKFDEPPTGWVEIDEKGNIREMVYDDTRDGVEEDELLGMMYARGKHDDGAFISPSVCRKPALYIWEEDDKEPITDVEEAILVAQMLGLEESSIETAEEMAETAQEFTRIMHYEDRKLKDRRAAQAALDREKGEQINGW